MNVERWVCSACKAIWFVEVVQNGHCPSCNSPGEVVDFDVKHEGGVTTLTPKKAAK